MPDTRISDFPAGGTPQGSDRIPAARGATNVYLLASAFRLATDTQPINLGGTGATTAGDARNNLGISATNTPFTPAGGIAASNVQAALEELAGDISGASFVSKDSNTGSAYMPTGTTAQRTGSPGTGYLRYNTTVPQWEFWNGSSWATLASASGGTTAASISLSPFGGISAINVQDGLAEVYNERQPLDDQLTAIANLSPSTNQMPYFTNSTTAALISLSADMLAFLDDANFAAMRTSLGLVIGTNVQAFDDQLAAIAGLAPSANQMPYFTGATTAGLTSLTAGARSILGLAGTANRFPYFSATDVASLGTITSAGLAILDDVDASAQRTTLGLGTAATLNVGTGPNNVVQLDGSSRLPAVDGSQLSGLPSGVPAGAVMPFAMSTAPSGWLKCNGAAVSRTTYAALFTAIGTTFGSGDGSTTFNLPELRAEWVRGWDDSRGVDSGRAFGSSQAEQIGVHNHTASSNTAGAHTHTFTTGIESAGHTHSVSATTGTESADHTHFVSGSTSTDGSHTHGYSAPSVTNTGAFGGEPNVAGVTASNTDAGGSHSHTISITSGGRSAAHTHSFSTTSGGVSANHTHSGTTASDGDHSHTITVNNSAAGENRPRNVALLYCIKT